MEFMKINVFCFIICCLARSIAATDDGHKQQPNHPPALFLFGDSLADAGTNNFIPKCVARADFPPYGMSFFHHPTGRFTNGRTVFDFIATYMGLPFPSPFLDPQANFSSGINFASGGSGLLDSTGQNWNIISLNHQIRQFTDFASTLVKKNGNIVVESYLSKSLYCISAGANDVGNYIQNVTYQITTTPGELVALLLNKYDQYLSEVYEEYCHRHTASLVLGVGFVETRSACCGAGAFNAQVRCGQWKAKGAEKYKPFICKDPNTYLFWDEIHPTERLYAILAHEIWSGNSSVISPFNLSSLVLGNGNRMNTPP